jgi:hypothetical protein
MKTSKVNFLAGILVGAALAAAAPFAGAEFFATFSAPATAKSIDFAPQTVNRAQKSDRLHEPQNAIRTAPAKKPHIPEGCDPAFSPLSKGAASNFSGRCLA